MLLFLLLAGAILIVVVHGTGAIARPLHSINQGLGIRSAADSGSAIGKIHLGPGDAGCVAQGVFDGAYTGRTGGAGDGQLLLMVAAGGGGRSLLRRRIRSIAGPGQGCLHGGAVGVASDGHQLGVQIHLHIVDAGEGAKRLANLADAALAAGALNREPLCLHPGLRGRWGWNHACCHRFCQTSG